MQRQRQAETARPLHAVVAPIHPKAMPVILTKPDEIEEEMIAPAKDALGLQRPLYDALRIVAGGRKQDAYSTEVF